MGNKQAKKGSSKERTLDTEDLDFLRTNTNFDEKTIREWHRGFYEDCPSGKLSPKKFMEVYKVFFPGGNAESFCDHVFRTFDQDKSGYIDFKEFLLAINVTSSGTPEQKLHWAFRMYDIDGNGTIDRREMTRIIQAIYEMLGTDTNGADGAESPQERATRIFEKMDTNHDTVLSKDEFVRGCMEDEDLRQMLASATGGGSF